MHIEIVCVSQTQKERPNLAQSPLSSIVPDLCYHPSSLVSKFNVGHYWPVFIGGCLYSHVSVHTLERVKRVQFWTVCIGVIWVLV